MKCKPSEIASSLLEALIRAPIKPQQRLFALRIVVMPRLYHQLALGAVTIGELNKVDKLVRGTLRKWLVLLHDTPNAYFHASVRDGDLGVPSVRWTAPVQRRGRLLAVMQTCNQEGLKEYVEKEFTQCVRRLTDHGIVYNNPEMIARRWLEKLCGSIDGAGLKESTKKPHQHQWLADGNRFLSGKDFVN